MKVKFRISEITKRKGLIIEIGRFGMFIGFWFITIDILGKYIYNKLTGNYHLDIG